MAENSVVYEAVEVISRPLETVKQEILSLTRQAQVNSVHYICEIGKRLLEAKEQVGHGEWGNWLNNEVNYSQSTAENFMKIYKEYGNNQLSLFSDMQNSQTLGKLEFSKLLLLTSVPAEDREEIAKEVDAENISVRELQERLKERTAELEEERNRSRESSDRILKLRETISDREKKIEKLKNNISELEKDIEDVSDIGSGEMEQAQKAELEKVKADYEKKLQKLKDKNDSEIRKKTDAEEKLKSDLKKAKTETEAALQKYESLQREAKKADLAGNADMVLINEYVKRLQMEAETVISAMNKLKTHENYEKLKNAVKTILDSITERMM